MFSNAIYKKISKWIKDVNVRLGLIKLEENRQKKVTNHRDVLGSVS